jgi:uncharacterized protein (TIGR02001 family)
MKKLIATAATALMLASTLPAAFEASVGYNSDYYFRGVQLSDDFVEAGIEFSEGSFYAGVWTAQPLDSEYVKEYDLYAGYGIDASEEIALDFGATAYIYSEGDSTYEFFAGASFDFGLPVAPAVYFYYDIELEVFTAEVSAGYTIEIDEVSSVELSAAVGHARSDDSDYNYYLLSASYSYAISDALSVSASVNYTDASDITNKDDGFYYSIGGSFSF